MQPDPSYTPEPIDSETLLLMRLEQERNNDHKDEWFASYGFEHDCSCADDAEAGNLVEIPECYAGAAAEAFKSLRTARNALLAIATSDTSDSYALKQLAHEVYFDRA